MQGLRAPGIGALQCSASSRWTEEGLEDQSSANIGTLINTNTIVLVGCRLNFSTCGVLIRYSILKVSTFISLDFGPVSVGVPYYDYSIKGPKTLF